MKINYLYILVKNLFISQLQRDKAHSFHSRLRALWLESRFFLVKTETLSTNHSWCSRFYGLPDYKVHFPTLIFFHTACYLRNSGICRKMYYLNHITIFNVFKLESSFFFKFQVLMRLSNKLQNSTNWKNQVC